MTEQGDGDFERKLGDRLRKHLNRPMRPFDARAIVDGLDASGGGSRARSRWTAMLAVAATVVIAGLLTVSVLGIRAPGGSPKPTGVPATSGTPSASASAGSATVDYWGEVASGGVWVRRGSELDITTDNGATWVRAPVDPKASPVSVFDSAHVWTVTLAAGSTQDTGSPSDIRHFIVNWTIDGGRTWHAVPIAGNYPSMQPVLSFPDVLHGFLLLARGRFATQESVVFSTQDGGRSWSNAGGAPSLGPRFIAIDTLEMFAGNAPSAAGVKLWPLLMRSRDSGATWHEVSVGASDDAVLVARPTFFESTGVLVVLDGSGSHIFRSSDGGVTWERGASVPCADGLATAAMPSPLDWFVAGPNCNAISVTHDGGTSWQRVVPSGLPAPLEWIGFTDATHGAAVVISGVLAAPANFYLTTDGGKTWRPAHLPGG